MCITGLAMVMPMIVLRFLAVLHQSFKLLSSHGFPSLSAKSGSAEITANFAGRVCREFAQKISCVLAAFAWPLVGAHADRRDRWSCPPIKSKNVGRAGLRRDSSF